MKTAELTDELLSRLTSAPLTDDQVIRIRSRIDRALGDTRQPRVRRFALVVAVALVLCGSAALGMYGLPRLGQSRLTSEPVILELPDAASPPPVVDPEGSLGAESRLLASALHHLRKNRDPKAALVALDRYDAEFAHGTLARESRAARIEALLVSDRKREVLAMLDGPRDLGSDLLVLRGELRLEAGRVADAARDFDAALLGKRDAIEARALYGRAACRIRLGDRSGARRDLDDYLARFPAGKRADDARAALAALDQRDRQGSQDPAAR